MDEGCLVMALTNSVSQKIIVKVILSVLITVLFVYSTNLITLTYVNKDSEYASQYQTKFDKGYLTEDEVEVLVKLEQKYINDQEARNQRMNRFFGTLSIGMLIYSFIIYLVMIQSHLSNGVVFLTLTIAISAAVVSGSFWQSIFWAFFFYIGNWFASRKLLSKQSS
jgi:hypothetical protein